MRDTDFFDETGFYPPEEDPVKQSGGPVILDDGPEGPGKWTKEKSGWGHKESRKPEPDYLDYLEES